MIEHAADIKISVSHPLLSIIAVSLLLLASPLYLDSYKSLSQNDYNYDVNNVEKKMVILYFYKANFCFLRFQL